MGWRFVVWQAKSKSKIEETQKHLAVTQVICDTDWLTDWQTGLGHNQPKSWIIMDKGLSNYNNWRQSVMTLKQKIAGAELYFSRAYSSFWWSQENGWRSYNCHSKNYHVGLFRNAKGSKETWVLPHTNQTQYQKWMSRKLNFVKNYFIWILPKHIASIDFSKRPLEHAFAPHFASNYCSCCVENL